LGQVKLVELGLLIFFGVLAGVVLYQLYAVLGRRVGRQPEEVGIQPAQPAGQLANSDQTPPKVADPALSVPGMENFLAQEPGFDLSAFMTGALDAHRSIVEAYYRSDREALWALLSKPMLEVFETGMAERDSNGQVESVTFVSPTRADLETATVQDHNIQLAVRFLSELQTTPISASTEAETDQAQSRRTAEVWTFERPLRSKDPHWRLVHVAAAVG
jgi:predicted lipid-binding transport protein (Tim44 family)